MRVSKLSNGLTFIFYPIQYAKSVEIGLYVKDMIINILLEYKEKETARSVIYTIDDAIKKIEEMDEMEEDSDE